MIDDLPEGFRRVVAPMADMPHEERVGLLKEKAAEASQRFEQLAGELDDRLAQVDPVHVMSLAGLSLVVTQGSTIGQHEAELIAGMLLRYPRDHYQALVGTPDQVQTCFDLAKELTALYALMPLADVPDDPAGQDRLGIMHEMRMYTQVMRGDFYAEQLSRFFRPVLQQINRPFTHLYNIGATELFDCLDTLSKRIEDRLNRHISRLSSFFQVSGVERICSAYGKAFPETKQLDPDEIKVLMEERGLDETRLKFMLLAHADLRVPDVFTLREVDLSAALANNASPANLQSLCAVLDATSVSFGDFKDTPFEFLRLDNPLWSRPIVKLDKMEWLWPTPTTFFSYAVRIFEELCSRDEKLKSAFEDAKAEGLEKSLVAVLREVIPTSTLHNGVKWTGLDGKGYETDLLGIFDDWIMIIEGKSGKISDSARRGSFERLKRETKRLVLDPAGQSKRLEELLTAPGLHSFVDTDGRTFTIDQINADKIVRITVNFEAMGTFISRTRVLKEAGLIDTEASIPVTMNLSSFDIVVRALKRPAAILLYLLRRSKFEAKVGYLADELDLLVFFRDTGLLVDYENIDDSFFMIYGHSNDLDVDLTRERQHAMKPFSRSHSSFIERILLFMEQHPFSGWISASLALLALTSTDQKNLERAIRKAVAQTRDAPRSGGMRVEAGHIYAGVAFAAGASAGEVPKVPPIVADLKEDGAAAVTLLPYQPPIIARPTAISVL